MDFVNLLILLVICSGLTYFGITMAVGLLESRRRSRRPVDVPASSWATDEMVVYFLIPCLNEELVIGDTVAALLAQTPRGLVVVIDDASDDRTAEVAREAGGNRVQVLQRMLPDARLGKGKALNAGYDLVLNDVRSRWLEEDQVVVCIVDADGQMTPGAVDAALRTFQAEPDIGALQIPVRIRNRDHWLARMQDFEFWVISAVTQIGRMRTGTTSLGGNGQFSRLSALRSLGGRPWSDCLTEDLDLSLRLLLRGWRTSCVADHHVSQQGIENIRALIRQRTRWFQGHVSCNTYIPKIWRSPRLSNAVALETSTYLLVPTALILPWSILGHISLFQLGHDVLYRAPNLSVAGSPGLGKVLDLVLLYLVSFAPNIFAGYLYFRRDRAVGRFRAFVVGHAMIPYNYVAYAAVWRAVWRLARGTHGWDKTARTVEPRVAVA